VDHEGFVHLRGGVTGTNSSPAVIATLPVGARPAGAANTSVAFAVPTYLGKVEQVLISADGTIISFIGSAYGFVGLDGIAFPAA
jgi:hypothetical protein